MLGVYTEHLPISGKVAESIREALLRISTGQLNEVEKASVDRSKEILDQYESTWIGLDGEEQ